MTILWPMGKGSESGFWGRSHSVYARKAMWTVSRSLANLTPKLILEKALAEGRNGPGKIGTLVC
jgi:hypothetical protein